ncbi:MAG: YeeE/YedE family protein [Candidatus Aminicenantes bacterium]|nr:YeeE/YedE family protein [Candidatus Aminicenantes bacterium]
MVSSGKNDDGRPRWLLFWLNILAALAFLLAAALTRHWVWTAVPIGQLFGFFLAKGDLCGASAFSEILLMRDGRKAFGIWTAIVTAMIFFAVMQAAGLATLAPKPLLWANAILGGLIFGAGTVLAGGCISGCLYKAAGGNLNSIVALLTIPSGIAFVEHGPLAKLNGTLKSIKSVASNGGPVTLPSLTGLPFWAWALILFVVTLLIAGLLRRRAASPTASRPDAGIKSSWLTKPWRPWQAGLAVGVVVAFSLISSAASGRNYPIGVTHGVLNIQELITDNHLAHVFGPPASTVASSAAAASARAAASLTGRIRLAPKPPGQVVTAAAGGFLVGAGASLATGCVVGNILSGWALMSAGMFLFGLAVVLANWAVTYFYLMNGTLGELPGTLRLIFKRHRSGGPS